MDETNFEEWLCDMTWNCSNGTNKAYSGFFNYSSGYYRCLIAKRTENESVANYVCLPIPHAGDGIIDCFNGSDERQFCRNSVKYDVSKRYLYYGNQIRLVLSPSSMYN